MNQEKAVSLLGCLVEGLEAEGHDGNHKDCQRCLDVNSANQFPDEVEKESRKINVFDHVKQTISAYWSDSKMTEYEAEKELAKIGAEELAVFILNVVERGWITKFNLGLNEDGEVI